MTEAEAVIRRVIAAEGTEVFLDARRLEALLMDYSGGVDPRGTRLLAQAVRVGSVAAFVCAGEHESRERKKQVFVERMNSVYGTDRELATWAVEVWASVVSDAQINKRLVGDVDRFHDLGNGTVVDTRTGLHWRQCSVGQVWSYKKCVGEPKIYPAESMTDGLKTFDKNETTFAGRVDWRLPYTHEVLSLIEENRLPKIRGDIFPETPDGFFWSLAESGNLECVSFHSGKVFPANSRKKNYVRLVRNIAEKELDSKKREARGRLQNFVKEYWGHWFVILVTFVFAGYVFFRGIG